MPCVLGITGGIASGKSIFTKQLLRSYPCDFFDCDVAARELVENDPQVQAELFEKFPEAVHDSLLDRAILRQLVFSDKSKRLALEALLHPRIRQQWVDRASQAKLRQASFIVEIPLLFETGAEDCFDAVALVGSTEATQMQRLNANRNTPADIAQAIIASQEKLSIKIAKADHLIWNESSISQLQAQAELFAGYLKHRYG